MLSKKQKRRRKKRKRSLMKKQKSNSIKLRTVPLAKTMRRVMLLSIRKS